MNVAFAGKTLRKWPTPRKKPISHSPRPQVPGRKEESWVVGHCMSHFPHREDEKRKETAGMMTLGTPALPSNEPQRQTATECTERNGAAMITSELAKRRGRGGCWVCAKKCHALTARRRIVPVRPLLLGPRDGRHGRIRVCRVAVMYRTEHACALGALGNKI